VVTPVRAPNPSAMTLEGTNSYIVDCGDGAALAIDPGPPIERHAHALIDAARQRGLTIAAIAFTHGHPDHAPNAQALKALTGAPVYGHPASTAAHDVDVPLEGELLVGTTALRVLDAPGHTFDHVIYYLPAERALFTGDTILGTGPVLIAPPGGDMRAYQRTLQRLRDEFSEASVIFPGHGPRVDHVAAKIDEYIEHRRERERELLDALRRFGGGTIPELVSAIYGDDRPQLLPAMARQLLAHLIALQREGRVNADPVDRTMTARESWILNPPVEDVAGPDEAALVRAELGTQLQVDRLYRYFSTNDAGD
jgi:glyoxylase-like metal-dependent hydrolase (beta-lactamase superfamily II)